MDVTTSTPASPEYLDQNNAPTILGVTGALTLLVVIVVSLRLYVRIRMLRFVGPDDYVIIAAVVMTVANFAGACAAAQHGLGRHIDWITEGGRTDRMETLMLLFFIQTFWLVFALILVKISVALFLIPILPLRWWKTFLYSCIAFFICYAVACFVVLMLTCIPIAAIWNFALRQAPGTWCTSEPSFTAVGIFNSVFNIVTDVLLATLPIPIVARLTVNLGTKASLIFILSLGYVACGAGIAKTHAQFGFLSDPDRMYHDTFFIWAMLEVSLAITAASLPGLKPLVKAVLQGSRTDRTPQVDGGLAVPSRGRVTLSDGDVEAMSGVDPNSMGLTITTIRAVEASISRPARGLRRLSLLFSRRSGQAARLLGRGEMQEAGHQPGRIYATKEVLQSSDDSRQ